MHPCKPKRKVTQVPIFDATQTLYNEDQIFKFWLYVACGVILLAGTRAKSYGLFVLGVWELQEIWREGTHLLGTIFRSTIQSQTLSTGLMPCSGHWLELVQTAFTQVLRRILYRMSPDRLVDPFEEVFPNHDPPRAYSVCVWGG